MLLFGTECGAGRAGIEPPAALAIAAAHAVEANRGVARERSAVTGPRSRVSRVHYLEVF